MTIILRPMTESEYVSFYEQSVEDYAADNVRAGYWTQEESLANSAKAFERLLPQGLNTENNLIFVLAEDDLLLGFVWLNIQQKADGKNGFIYQVQINEDQRGKGYGKRIMLLLEDKARELGISKIGLHVFGFNEVAKNLYQSLGYEVTSQNMVKKI